MSSHYHVATGLAGYGPDAADTDGFATFDTLGSALDFARDELLTFIDMAYEGAHDLACHASQYHAAWKLDNSRDAMRAMALDHYAEAWQEIERMETMETLRANLDPSRKQAPLYANDDAAYAELEKVQAAEFPHDVSRNTRLYLWECDDDDCESAADDDDDKPAHCGAWKPETHEDRGPIDCGCGWGAYCELSSEYVGSEAERWGIEQARTLLEGTAGYETRTDRVVQDEQTGLWFAWNGAHTVNVRNVRDGQDHDCYSIGDFAKDAASEREFRQSIASYVRERFDTA